MKHISRRDGKEAPDGADPTPPLSSAGPQGHLKGPFPKCSRRSRCQKVSRTRRTAAAECFKSNPYNLKINCCHELVDSPVNSHIGAAGFSWSDLHIPVGLDHRTDFFKQCLCNIWMDFCPKHLFASSPFFPTRPKCLIRSQRIITATAFAGLLQLSALTRSIMLS